jgi:hypothetical protein
MVKFITLLWSTKAQVGAVTLGCTDLILTAMVLEVAAHLVVAVAELMVVGPADRVVDWVIKTTSP